MATAGYVGVPFDINIQLASAPAVNGAETAAFTSDDPLLTIISGTPMTFDSTNWNVDQKLRVKATANGTYHVTGSLSAAYHLPGHTLSHSIPVTITTATPDTIVGNTTGVLSVANDFIDNGDVFVVHTSIGGGDPGVTVWTNETYVGCRVTAPDGTVTDIMGTTYRWVDTSSQVGIWIIKVLQTFDVRISDTVFGPIQGTEPAQNIRLYSGNGIGGTLFDSQTKVYKQFIYQQVWHTIPGRVGGVLTCGDFLGLLAYSFKDILTYSNCRVTGGFSAGTTAAHDPYSLCLTGVYVNGASDIYMASKLVGTLIGACN